MDGIAAVLDQEVERVERQQTLIGVPRVDVGEKRVTCFSSAARDQCRLCKTRPDAPVGLLLDDQLAELDVHRMIGLWQGGVTCLLWQPSAESD